MSYKMSEYERTREANIQKNKALLQSLGLDGPLIEPKEKPRKKAAPSKKRKAVEAPSEGDAVAVDSVAEHPAKAVKTENATEGVRRSSRHAGKTVDYKSEIRTSEVKPLTFKFRDSENQGPLGSDAGTKRRYNPKHYGSIPGVDVGTWWQTRQGCSDDAIHAPWVGGISGGKDGAHSVALSGGYDDDVDLGYAFTYTGSGGRDLKGTKASPKNLRTAPQSSDQTFENTFNKMLLRSSETRKPVRVIRGYKLKSEYAPSEGYRYDGLYIVEKAWQEKGLNPKGYLVCKYAFKRLPNQPHLQVRNIDDEGESDSADQEEDEKDFKGEEDVKVEENLKVEADLEVEDGDNEAGA